jgi:hypothetical protein
MCGRCEQQQKPLFAASGCSLCQLKLGRSMKVMMTGKEEVMREIETLNPMTDSELITDLLKRDNFTCGHVIMRECCKFIGKAHIGFLFGRIVLDYVSARIGETHLAESAEDRWIGKSRQAWMEYSYLSAYRLRKAIKTLQDRGLIELRLSKSAAGKQLYVRVDPTLIDRLLLAAAKSLAQDESEYP